MTEDLTFSNKDNLEQKMLAIDLSSTKGKIEFRSILELFLDKYKASTSLKDTLWEEIKREKDKKKIQKLKEELVRKLLDFIKDEEEEEEDEEEEDEEEDEEEEEYVSPVKAKQPTPVKAKKPTPVKAKKPTPVKAKKPSPVKKCKCIVASTGKKCDKDAKEGSRYCGIHKECKKDAEKTSRPKKPSPKKPSPKKPSPKKPRLFIFFDKEDDEAYFGFFNDKKVLIKTTSELTQEEFKPYYTDKRKIELQDDWRMLLDKMGEPYYNKKGTREASRDSPFKMSKVFPKGFEVLSESPYYKGTPVEVSVSSSESESESESETESDHEAKLDQEFEQLREKFPGNKGSLDYLRALNKNIACDSEKPCSDGECDLEYKRCVPKTATEYYDDIERFEHNGASYVGKKTTIQKMKLAIEAEKAEKDAEAEEAKKKAKAEKDSKKKKPAADASPKGKADDLDFDIDEEGDLTELQQALIDCLMPAVKK
jgi:hypothetical protein